MNKLIKNITHKVFEPICRCFLIWSNIGQIFFLLSKLTLIKWKVYFQNDELMDNEFKNNSLCDDFIQSNKTLTSTSEIEGQYVQQIQFPILFIAAMMCIVLYFVGLIGSIQKNFGIVLSYATILLLLSFFNLLMAGFNPVLWIFHLLMAIIAFCYSLILRAEENLLLAANEPKFDPI